MAELVVVRGKPCVERRELISTGRVEPVEGEEWMSPGPLQSSAPSSPKLPPMVPDPLSDRIEQSVNLMVARAMSGFKSSIRVAIQDYTLEVPRQSSQSRSSVDLENSVDQQQLISVGRVEPFEEEGSMLSVPPRTPSPRSTPQPPPNFPSPVAGDMESTRTETIISRIEASFREAMAGFSRELLAEMSQVCRSVEDLEIHIRCQEEEAFRRSASSDLSDGAHGGKTVAGPPSPKPDPDQTGSGSRRVWTTHPQVADPCLKSIVEAIPPPPLTFITPAACV